MMTIQTSKGKTFLAEWFGETLDHKFIAGEIITPSDITFLSDLVDDFESIDYIDRYDECEGDRRFMIDDKLRSISWTDRGTIHLEFFGVGGQK